MNTFNKSSAAILGVFIFLGLSLLGYFLGSSAIAVKEYERVVQVKGLAEKDYPADIVIWPIQFNAANNDLSELYQTMDQHSQSIKIFLLENGIDASEISMTAPAIVDKTTHEYGNQAARFRYSGKQTVTVYTKAVVQARSLMSKLSKLGKQGIVFTANNYEFRTEYIFTRLNEVKPQMVELSTKNAREVAEKFAADSNSQLGKIKRASQGQFSISPRDVNNPHIKKVRVVSTVVYYLSD